VRRWLHNRERPSPGLSAQLRPPRLARLIPGVRSAGGRLLTTGPAMATRVARYWAAISAAPAVDTVAQDAVLAAMAGGAPASPRRGRRARRGGRHRGRGGARCPPRQTRQGAWPRRASA
jgi:hypothetical protein